MSPAGSHLLARFHGAKYFFHRVFRFVLFETMETGTIEGTKTMVLDFPDFAFDRMLKGLLRR